MDINRNNYEDFFLLYADNELSKTERKVVEIFVQENPDLKEEFGMWKLSINTPDEDVKLMDKSFLLKKEPPFINENNYEEIFVRYHDNELSGEKRKETENFAAENSTFKTDFELIGKAKLIPDTSIVFPGKKSLYRKEKNGKVIPMILWRSMVAAVFIGFGLWITISYYNKNDVSQSVATTTNNNVQKSAIKDEKPDTNIVSQKPGKEDNNIVSSTKTTRPAAGIKKNKTEIEKPVLKEQKIKEEAVASNIIKTNNKPAEQKTNLPKPDVDYQLVASDKPVKDLPAIIEKTETPLAENNIAIQANKIDPDIQNVSHAKKASYLPDANINNQNYVFYDVSADEFRKSKVGGFLKKVTRVVERNNPIIRLLAERDIVAK